MPRDSRGCNHFRIRRRTIVLFVVIVAPAAIFSCILLALANKDFFIGLYNDFVLDNKEHFLSCEELPSRSDVMKVMDEHQDTIEKIERVNPGFVYVSIDTESCPGKADIVIDYASHRDRLAIEAIIDGETFFRVPYRGRNR